MLIKIREDEGLKYSKISGDKNKIHIDNLTGYNSIFGEKICHGTHVISKVFKNNFFKKIILSKKKFNIFIQFFDFIKYNENIVVKKNKNTFNVFQNGKIKICILIKKKNILYYENKHKKLDKNYKKKLTIIKNKYNLILKLLSNISSYVGNIYPGKYSLISSININFNENYNECKDKILVKSFKLNKQLPLIKNILFYDKFNIEFETLERPIVKKNKFFLKKDIKKKIQEIKDNVLVIGGSSGIGNDFLKIFKFNKKIMKIFTFNKNNIQFHCNDIHTYKIDVFKDLNKVNEIIQKFGPIKVFYFPSPKIFFNKRVDKKKYKEYEEFFLNIPIKILKNNRKKIVSLFYPSTSNIDEDKNSDYSKIKRLAEISLQKLCKKNSIIYKSIRFPALNSKQSVSLLNPTPQSFFQYLNKYPKMVSKIF